MNRAGLRDDQLGQETCLSKSKRVITPLACCLEMKNVKKKLTNHSVHLCQMK